MQAYTNRNSGRSLSSCGYCRATGHAITDCPTIEYDHNEWEHNRVPHTSGTLVTNRWMMGDFSYWIKQINKYYPKWVKAQNRKTDKSTGKKRVTAPKKCGFCGDHDHNRRSCSKMVAFVADLNRANANYRQAFYNKVVKEMGLGVGALVKARVAQRGASYGDTVEKLCLVEKFDLSKVNIFGVVNTIDCDYRGRANVEIGLQHRTITLNLAAHGTEKKGYSYPINPRHDPEGRTVVCPTGGFYQEGAYLETMAPSKEPLDEAWVSTTAMSNEFEWLTKKRSYEWLVAHGVHDVVEEWK